MVNELVTIVGLIGANLGAIGACIESWYSKPEDVTFSKRLLVGAIIGSSLASFTTIQILPLQDAISTIGYIGIFVASVIGGIGAAKLFRRTNS